MSIFSVYDLKLFRWVIEEKMGTKARDWYQVTNSVPELEEGTRWLYKVPDRFPGEIWAEKLACEIGAMMELPIAGVEFARFDGETGEVDGTISLSFADCREHLVLEHGNELMEAQSHRRKYSLDEEGQVGLDAVYDYLRVENIEAPRGAAMTSQDATFYFTGYLVLDALIGNVDRHHQNWGVIRTADGNRYLAPTFDHGACLGRELGAEKRTNYLQSRQVSQYATRRKGRAKIAPPDGNDRIVPFKVLDFLPSLGQDQALCFWLERALKIDDGVMERLFAQVPRGLVSPDVETFAREFTKFTRGQLMSLREEIC